MNARTRRETRSPRAMSSLPIHRASSSSSVVENSFELKFIFPFRAKSVRPVRPVRPASPFSPRARLVLASHLARVSPSLALSNTTSLDARIPSALVARDECAHAFERMRARRECNEMTRANALERGRRRRDVRRDPNPNPSSCSPRARSIARASRDPSTCAVASTSPPAAQRPRRRRRREVDGTTAVVGCVGGEGTRSS